uniref:CSON005129 protein n=1 Tax=Culicoides sonorensis TaxID=179676 RepID=A0A336LUI7_CULSO
MSLKSDSMWPRITSEFKKSDPNHRSLTAIFQFNVKRNGQLRKIITIDCKNLTIKDGAVEDPDAILFIEDDALINCAKREATILQSIKDKKASVTGDLDLFQKLSDKFPKKH